MPNTAPALTFLYTEQAFSCTPTWLWNIFLVWIFFSFLSLYMFVLYVTAAVHWRRSEQHLLSSDCLFVAACSRFVHIINICYYTLIVSPGSLLACCQRFLMYWHCSCNSYIKAMPVQSLQLYICSHYDVDVSAGTINMIMTLTMFVAAQWSTLPLGYDWQLFVLKVEVLVFCFVLFCVHPPQITQSKHDLVSWK